ncbi:IclR family transcriptional regulator [Parapedobacter pyrenivorans]|uniref:IclR family transcriptional regulator n=1 Tax=Parapedobacter pyrenivorans TaxID=1305674 RepID=A0A917HUM6_9SPHI|nr:IclR family transcriptional regulator [Parapedobacter pyrenivorans]GGG89768.1 IclR family transcriptional regulator [Parapedobacter pyrenivorans]
MSVEEEGDHNNNSKYHVPNLERALYMIELLSSSPAGMGITEISNQLGISKNSTFRIAMTLLHYGYLTRDENSKAFNLSGKLLSVGYAAVTEQNLLEKSLDVLRDLRNTTKETVLIGIILADEGVVLEQVPGLHSFKFWIDVGTRFPLHTAVPSKAILAFLPEKVQQPICSRIEFKKYTNKTITKLDVFLDELKRVKETGYAIDGGEEVEGMHCIGAPIFNGNSYPVAAIWITGPSDRLPVTQFEHVGKVVKEQALRISQRLGYFAK